MAINSDTISGNWEQLKGKVKSTWGKLTDDDLMRIRGESQAMVGRLQELYGYSKERAEQEWKNFTEKEGTCSSKDKNSSCCN